jgi:acyl carrier protein
MQTLAADKVDLISLQLDVLQEIRRQLTPYVTCGQPITGATVISDGATIDSLTVMDMVMELEDRFDVSIPMNTVAEIRTVDELADTIIRLRHP